jgi:hypothetical protein
MRSKGCRYSSMTRLRSEVIAAESAGSPPTDPIDSQARVVMFSGAWSIRSAWAVRSAMSWSRTGVFPLKWPLQLSGEFVYVSES